MASQAGFTSWEQLMFVFAIMVPALAYSLFVQMWHCQKASVSVAVNGVSSRSSLVTLNYICVSNLILLKFHFNTYTVFGVSTTFILPSFYVLHIPLWRCKQCILLRNFSLFCYEDCRALILLVKEIKAFSAFLLAQIICHISSIEFLSELPWILCTNKWKHFC